MWHSRPPRDPPPFMANAILNFHFDFLHPSLSSKQCMATCWQSVVGGRPNRAFFCLGGGGHFFGAGGPRPGGSGGAVAPPVKPMYAIVTLALDARSHDCHQYPAEDK